MSPENLDLLSGVLLFALAFGLGFVLDEGGEAVKKLPIVERARKALDP
jgi:hypothetical protein